MRGFASTAIAAAALISGAFADNNNPVDPIVIKGSKFFYKTNGTQFFLRGVAYQQDATGNGSVSTTNGAYTDPLADASACQRDIPLLQALRTNVIRTYAIDPTQNHDKCMQLLNDAGIYVVSDLSQPNLSINRDDPQWNIELYNRYTAVVDALAGYSNTLGFFAGNEVSNAINNTAASAFVKAAVRDTKAYIKSKNYRAIGVGYATNDDSDIRQNMAAYFNCGDQSSAIDFWGYNIYSWCGDSSFSASGYQTQTNNFKDYSVPVFFAEYGCNTVLPRKFTEVGALFGSQMTGVWSGGILYMYFQEANNYGLVSVSGSTASKLPDYTAYSSQMAKATPTGVSASSYSPSNSPAACPAIASNWAAPSVLPPTPNSQLCSCMVSSLSCYASSSIKSDDLGTLFGQVCGYNGGKPCAGINRNSTNGAFGAYSMCNATDQLSWAFNTYYTEQNKASSACNFDGSASTKSSSSGGSSCSSLISQAGTSGTGSVTSAPSSGTGSSGSTGKGAGAALSVQSIHLLGGTTIGVSVVAAILSAAAVLAL